MDLNKLPGEPLSTVTMMCSDVVLVGQVVRERSGQCADNSTGYPVGTHYEAAKIPDLILDQLS